MEKLLEILFLILALTACGDAADEPIEAHHYFPEACEDEVYDSLHRYVQISGEVVVPDYNGEPIMVKIFSEGFWECIAEEDIAMDFPQRATDPEKDVSIGTTSYGPIVDSVELEAPGIFQLEGLFPTVHRPRERDSLPSSVVVWAIIGEGMCIQCTAGELIYLPVEDAENVVLTLTPDGCDCLR